METGIFIKSMTLALSPCAMPINVVKSTMTNTSSSDAPARIICGILLFVPYFSSISCTILGTTTAGDTAPSTAPMIKASILVTLSIVGARKTKARISNTAGKNDISIAGRPTFFKSLIFNERPALIRIMTSAIWRSSDEIPRIDGSNRSSTKGPSIIPVISIPMILGNFILWQIAARLKPARKINASEFSIKILL